MEKIQLEYVWIENYRCLKRIGLNFLNDEIFEFKEGHLNKEEIKGQQFSYGSVNDEVYLTAIVGDNAVGKTTIMNILFSLSWGDGGIGGIFAIYRVYTENGIEYVLYKNGIEIDNKDDYFKPEHVHDFSSQPICNLLDDLEFIYYSNLVPSFSKEFYGGWNISTQSEYQKAETSVFENLDKGFRNPQKELRWESPFYVYLEREFDKQVELVAKKRSLLDSFGIQRDSVRATLKCQHIVEDAQHDIVIEHETVINKFLPLTQIKNIDTFKDAMSRSMLIHYLDQYRYSVNLDTIVPYKSLLQLISDLSENYTGKRGIDKLREFFIIILEEEKKKLGVAGDCGIEAYLGFIDYIDKARYSDNAFNNYRDYNSFKIGIDSDTDSDINDIRQFLEHYSRIPKIEGFLGFEWGLSSGEMSILSLFSRLYDLSKKDEIKNNLVILLDEAETTLHPEWQRQFIFAIKNGLKSLFDKKNIQVIISTHSPIVLSDIPKKNVIYLKKGDNGTEILDSRKRKETFGANIYDLYKDGFYLWKYFGEVAEDEINEIIRGVYCVYNKLENNEPINEAELETYRMASKNVSLVGDDLIRGEILHMMDVVQNYLNGKNYDRYISK